ncbi:MAG: short-chain fatty acids transporter [Luteibaculaceae bacterium]|jgi:short-chain fatty acids transporter
MPFIQSYSRFFKRFFPSPFVIAILLSVFVAGMALLFGKSELSIPDLAQSWYQGLWNKGGLVFLVQMMLMLVLGHVLALSKPIDALLDKLTNRCVDTPTSVYWVCLVSLVFCWLNWGLGLVVAAVLARKIGNQFKARNSKLNYPLIGAAAYSGMMFWHGGLSGSAPLKVAEEGHLIHLLSGLNVAGLPSSISIANTLFSLPNLLCSLFILVALPLLLRFLSRYCINEVPALNFQGEAENSSMELDVPEGLEKWDVSAWFSKCLGILFFAVAAFLLLKDGLGLSAINPNLINTFLLGFALFFHKNLNSFLTGTTEAIQGSVGILLQFPLYFGIMGIMKDAGLVQQIADFFVQISSPYTFPIYTFFSAGLVNLFVPSGGGQWLVQGPIIIQACTDFGIPLEKGVMALAYGDQLTNMLQPFWALPLLGITGLKAKDILPYTLLIFGFGVLVYTGVLIIA